MSFASMFSGAPVPAVANLQRDASEAPAPDPEPEPAPAPSETAAVSSGASAPAGSATPLVPGVTPAPDLDEMARRLYEPLAARLRAELWLDRERAGVFGDV